MRLFIVIMLCCLTTSCVFGVNCKSETELVATSIVKFYCGGSNKEMVMHDDIPWSGTRADWIMFSNAVSRLKVITEPNVMVASKNEEIEHSVSIASLDILIRENSRLGWLVLGMLYICNDENKKE